MTCFPILYILSSNVPGFYIPSCRLLYFLSLPFCQFRACLSCSFPRSLSLQSIQVHFNCSFVYHLFLSVLSYLFHPCCSFLGFLSSMSCHYALQRQNTKTSKQIFPEKEYQGLSPNFYIHASVSDLCIYSHRIGLPILLEEICRPILGLYKSLTDT